MQRFTWFFLFLFIFFGKHQADVLGICIHLVAPRPSQFETSIVSLYPVVDRSILLEAYEWSLLKAVVPTPWFVLIYVTVVLLCVLNLAKSFYNEFSGKVTARSLFILREQSRSFLNIMSTEDWCSEKAMMRDSLCMKEAQLNTRSNRGEHWDHYNFAVACAIITLYQRHNFRNYSVVIIPGSE